MKPGKEGRGRHYKATNSAKKKTRERIAREKTKTMEETSQRKGKGDDKRRPHETKQYKRQRNEPHRKKQ